VIVLDRPSWTIVTRLRRGTTALIGQIVLNCGEVADEVEALPLANTLALDIVLL